MSSLGGRALVCRIGAGVVEWSYVRTYVVEEPYGIYLFTNSCVLLKCNSCISINAPRASTASVQDIGRCTALQHSDNHHLLLLLLTWYLSM